MNCHALRAEREKDLDRGEEAGYSSAFRVRQSIKETLPRLKKFQMKSEIGPQNYRDNFTRWV
jgi:hypothetical protein